MKLTILICLSLVLTTVFCGHSISKFEGRPFQRKPPSGMYLLGDLGLDKLTEGQQIIAYGDVNNDKFTDIMTLSEDQKTLTVSIYSHTLFTFVPNVTIVPGDKILAVSTGDFNFDGRLDLLITTQNPETRENQVRYYLRSEKAPYYGKGANKHDHSFELPGQAQGFVLDSNGNRRLDVMYVDKGERVMRTLVNGDVKRVPFSTVVSQAEGCLSYDKVSKNTFTTPHSNSFADLNGDCAADILITSENDQGSFIEIWLRNPKDSLFCLVDVIEVSEALHAISLADMSNNGKLDLIAVYEGVDKPLTINIIYNQFKSDPAKPCVLVDTAMSNPFKKDAFIATENVTGVNQIFTLPESYPVGTRLFATNRAQRPGRVRIGDINIDGYPDLLFIVDDPNNKDSPTGKIVLVLNQENKFTFNNWDKSGVTEENRPYYTVLNEESEKDPLNLNLSSIEATSASFFDFDENGKLGLWIATKTADSSTKLIGIYNFVSSEFFILKTLGLNGYKPSSSSPISESLGGLYYGATIECTVTKVDGETVLSKVAQMPQSAYTPLDLPYMFLGLGRTNNYIENFYMGISRKDDNNDQQQEHWNTIIPNSQLIVNPVLGKTWTLDIYVNPTSEALLITLVTGIILLILGAIIIYLHRQEKLEDAANQDRMIHIFG